MTLALGGDPPVQRPQAAVTRTSVKPRIDGVLEPQVWSGAPTIANLTQVEPVSGAAPSERTQVRILYDTDTLYIGVRCFDREPAKIIATQPSRDAELDPDDRIEMILDTFLDRRSAFYFQMSPAGSKGDALISGDGADYNKPWDGIWEGKTTIDAEGWTAEMAIPFQTLSFDEHGSTWGFNINRVIKRRNETDRWASTTPDAFMFQASRAGDITGFHDMKQGLGLDVVPFVVGTFSKEDTGMGYTEDFVSHVGTDIFYKLTPNLTGSFTLNTDFAETEVDERKVNLTRFALFFPEKRDFFLQDSGLFKFADLGSDLIPFFSRRIGLGPNGEEIQILAGAKLTGRQDDWNIGALDTQTEAEAGLDSENLSVARVSKNIGASWNVGGIVTHGNPESGPDNTLYGFDANWRANDGLGGKRTTSSVWFLGTSTEDAPGDDTAFGASISYPNDLWRWSLAAKQIDNNFNPALGFVPRTGIRRYDETLYYQPRIGGELRQLNFGVADSLFTDLGGNVETNVTTVKLVGFEFESGDELKFELDQTHEVLDQPFAITPSVTIAADTYDDTGLRAELKSALKRPFSLTASATVGGFLGGDSLRWSTLAAWRPSPFMTAGAEWEQNDIAFDVGDVETQIARLRLNFNFSPDLSWNNFVQWDSESDEYGINSRWRWIPVPGQEFFLVFNDTTDVSGSPHPEYQAVAFKAAYTFRY